MVTKKLKDSAPAKANYSDSSPLTEEQLLDPPPVERPYSEAITDEQRQVLSEAGELPEQVDEPDAYVPGVDPDPAPETTPDDAA